MVPKQLQNPELRFYLISSNSKLPMQKQWNTKNCYEFFDPILIQHIDNGGNYGVCCGYGNLIVIDFDDEQYYNEIVKHIPVTFTVRTALKRLYHMYYYLEDGVDMIKKTGIDIDGKRVVDIQAYHSGIVAPNSVIDRKIYTIFNDKQIQTISVSTLKQVFKFETVKPKQYKTAYQVLNDTPAVISTMMELESMGLKSRRRYHYECPLHSSAGGCCLFVNPNGDLHCFHCNFNGDINKLKQKTQKKDYVKERYGFTKY